MAKENKIKAGREGKPHIGIYGRCNSGKSTLLNFITGADHALVSSKAGTTTDPVRKSYEILNFSPVVFIDTAGLDDKSEIGPERIKKTVDTLHQIDLALIVFTSWSEKESEIIRELEEKGTPYLTIRNSCEFLEQKEIQEAIRIPDVAFDFSRTIPKDHSHLMELIKQRLPEASLVRPSMFDGIVGRNDVVILVCPIDSEAPAGRMILPQVQAIRNILDGHAIAVVIQPEQLDYVLSIGVNPKLIVTDSQAFARIRPLVPQGIELTSFSILLARLKGDYKIYSEGLLKVEELKDGDRILVLENCNHQVSCDDIGQVKIPELLRIFTGAKLKFTFIQGLNALPKDPGEFALAVQCGGCMVTRNQLQNRIQSLVNAGVAVTNYGMLLNKLLR